MVPRFVFIGFDFIIRRVRFSRFFYLPDQRENLKEKVLLLSYLRPTLNFLALFCFYLHNLGTCKAYQSVSGRHSLEETLSRRNLTVPLVAVLPVVYLWSRSCHDFP